MKRLLLAFSLFFAIPVNAAEITSKITDSVQLKVDGAAVQSTRIGASYSASGTNIQSTSFGGVGGAGTYDINTAGQAFSFSESFNAADTPVTSQTVTGGVIGSPNLYGDSVTQTGGDKGRTLGTLHWWNNANSSNASYGTNTAVENATSEFHIYSLEWNENSLRIFVDDVEFFVMNNSADFPFNDKFFFILNIAMGGTLGGNIPNDFNQSTMEIDYVRVYQ